MKIGTASLNQTPIDWANNKKNILDALNEAKSQEIELLCLPELCITGYGCEDLFLNPWLAEQALSILNEIIPYTDGITVTLGLPYHFKGNIFNVVALISHSVLIGLQAKQHLPKDGIHYEPRWFEPWPAGKVEVTEINGSTYPFGDRIYEIEGLKIGFEICEDAWVDNRPACKLLDQQVDIILNPSASHFALMKSVTREKKVIDASKEFNCTYVFANQLGNEAGRIIFDGDAVIAHRGELAASTPLFSFESCVISTCTIDYRSRSVTKKNIRADHTNSEEQFTAAISLGLFDYMRKSHSNGFVLSLSGGADSSTCLVLMAEMIKRATESLGIKRFIDRSKLNISKGSTIDSIANQIITTAYQATSYSSAETLQSAKSLAKSVGATFLHWSIDETFEQSKKLIEQAIGKNLSWQENDIALQNIQARSRSPLIWMLANIKNSLLITTSNRSEGAVGYTTMDGDTSGSIAPIAGVGKPFIISWLHWAEKTLGYDALHFVNSLTPSAELRPTDQQQADEDDLMPYAILNQIENLFVIEKLTPMQIYKKLTKEIDSTLAREFTIRFFSLWSKNQWKRERIAPSFHIDDHSIDPRSYFRFPILSGGFKNELDQIESLA